MKKNLVLYLITLILIPCFVVSIIYKSLRNETSQPPNKITTNITTTNKITTVIAKEKANQQTVKINKDNQIKELNLEDYIIGVVAGEMPASFNIEALKAQAVASRTYAMYKNNITLETTIDDQVYITTDEMKEKWQDDFNEYYRKITSAVNDTKNLVMKKNNKLFKSFYFAMSNGYTEDSVAVFGEDNIKSVSSPWDNESINKFIVETTFTKEEIKNLLKLNENIKKIEIVSRDKTNRVNTLKVNAKNFTGIEFRRLLNLRSTDFEIKETENSYIITTKGYGHGVGMSQYGANGMAKDNYTYKEILKHYYQDIEICEI